MNRELSLIAADNDAEKRLDFGETCLSFLAGTHLGESMAGAAHRTTFNPRRPRVTMTALSMGGTSMSKE